MAARKQKAGGDAAVSKDVVDGEAPPVSFERSIQRLGEIVEELEQGERPLEESLALFEEGIRLSKSSERVLESAERRIEELLGLDSQGRPVVRELDPD